jgi:hypothetical protein
MYFRCMPRGGSPHTKDSRLCLFDIALLPQCRWRFACIWGCNEQLQPRCGTCETVHPAYCADPSTQDR